MRWRHKLTVRHKIREAELDGRKRGEEVPLCSGRIVSPDKDREVRVHEIPGQKDSAIQL